MMKKKSIAVTLAKGLLNLMLYQIQANNANE